MIASHATSSTPWSLPPDLDFPAVPERYRGVWQRTLLETPQGRDTTTQVHWLQTDRWHADLRVPEGVDPNTPEGRQQLQGFCGLTRITSGKGGQPDVCTWHRLWDIQPPRSTPDAGYMVFEAPDRLIETGVHGQYLEVWERLPGTDGPFSVECRPAPAASDTHNPTKPHNPGSAGVLVLKAGVCSMTVHPRMVAWPDDLQPDETLAHLVGRHPRMAHALLDFSISLVMENGSEA